MLLRSEALPVHRSLALKSGPCAVPPFLHSEPFPVRCYAFPSLRALARASFSSRRLVSVRQICACAVCKDLSYLFRLQESRGVACCFHARQFRSHTDFYLLNGGQAIKYAVKRQGGRCSSRISLLWPLCFRFASVSSRSSLLLRALRLFTLGYTVTGSL